MNNGKRTVWGHSAPNKVWDSISWAPFTSALFGHQCRVGTDGGIMNCENGILPDNLINHYAKQMTRHIQPNQTHGP